MTDQLDKLVRLYRLIGEKRDSIPPYEYRDDAASRRHREALAALVQSLTETEGAIIRESGDITSIRLAGIRATSTQGLIGALGNWRTACERKIMGGAA